MTKISRDELAIVSKLEYSSIFFAVFCKEGVTEERVERIRGYGVIGSTLPSQGSSPDSSSGSSTNSDNRDS
jgi:hypothetical protein